MPSSSLVAKWHGCCQGAWSGNEAPHGPGFHLGRDTPCFRKKAHLQKEELPCQRPTPTPARVVHLLRWIWRRAPTKLKSHEIHQFNQPSTTHVPGLVLPATLFISGIVLGECSGSPWQPWIVLSILLGTSGCVCRKLGLRGRIAILLGLFVFGAGWSSYHLKYLSHEDILHITGSDDPDHRRLVRVEGIIQNVTHSRAGVHGDLHVSSLVDPTRGRRPVVGTLFTRLPASCSIVSGERIQCTGWVVPTRISGNEEDVHWAKHARYTGRRGYLLIPEPGNIMGLDV
ncbi:MAG: hypothetical protein CMJ36_00880 [Phycisphaerae bacterium]|nr:hypothetical protein [Phycisphaerae bacterium]